MADASLASRDFPASHFSLSTITDCWQDITVNRTLVYIVAGAALVVGGVALLTRKRAMSDTIADPITEAQRMLDRAQTKITEIEAGLRSSRDYYAQPA